MTTSISHYLDSKPDVFFAGYASSAVVEAITDFWEYFDPIRKFMPQNCSTDVQAAVAIMDGIFDSGNQAEINNLKKSFGMEAVEFSDDVASAGESIPSYICML